MNKIIFTLIVFALLYLAVAYVVWDINWFINFSGSIAFGWRALIAVILLPLLWGGVYELFKVK